VEALARAGVGHLRLVDHDVVGPSNLNRQLFALRSTLGQPKVAVAGARVLDINPECRVEPCQTFIHTDTLPDLLTPRPDVVIDAIDSMTCKVALLRAAHELGIPIVTAMGAGGRTDSSQLFVGDLSDTRICPLAARVRKELRKAGITRGIRCVYSLEPADNKRVANPVDIEPHRGPGRQRRPVGTISYMPAIVGLKVAEEVLRLLLVDTGTAL
jgi:tRNA A37 threonylcarbamoyladenosine dehydratase